MVEKLKAEIPAVGILKRSEYGDSKSYQVVCECGDPGHDHNLWVEADDVNVTVTIYTTAKSKWWSLNRWQKIWTLLTKGYIEYEADLIMNKQQALNYAETLNNAIIDVEEFRKESKWKANLQDRIAKSLAGDNK
jgi:hypothetical protein